MTSVLVTGAAGFIGSHFCERLLERGTRVIGIDNFDPFYPGAWKHANLVPLRAQPNFLFHETDIRDGGALETLLREHAPEAVVHLAARAGVAPSLIDPHTYYDINVLGTLSLFEACRKAGVSKVVMASSSSVYGASSVMPFRESAQVESPISPYAASKQACELLAHVYHHLHGMQVACARLFTVYGPRQRPDMAITKFARAISSGEPITLYDQNSIRDYTFVEDIVSGLDAILRGAFTYDIVNIGTGRAVSLRSLVHNLERVLGRTANVTLGAPRQGDLPGSLADIQHAGHTYGYRPSVSIEQGLQRFVDWLQQAAGQARQ